jgi:hypothetical protein
MVLPTNLDFSTCLLCIYLVDTVYIFQLREDFDSGALVILTEDVRKLISLIIKYDNNHPVHSSLLLNDKAY